MRNEKRDAAAILNSNSRRRNEIQIPHNSKPYKTLDNSHSSRIANWLIQKKFYA